MKHLKKLSVVLMLTTLFSVTFTSCIDNEVSPVVEAIYEAQADLIAAQANVQNAEATKLEAEATYQLALAAATNADATYTLEQVEELRIENEAAQIVVDKAVAQFNIDMVDLLAQLDEAGAQVAVEYALKYRMYANAASQLLTEKATKVYDLAYAQAQMASSYPGFALASLEVAVNNAKFQVEIQQERIAALQALIDDPTSLPNQKAAWLQQQVDLAASVSAKTIEVNAKQNEADLLLAGANGEQSVRNAFVTLFETYEKQADTTDTTTAPKNWAYQIDVLQDQIDDLTETAGDYAGALTAAETALETAEDAYDAAWLALGDTEDSFGNTISFDGTYQYYQTDADEVAIGAGGEKYTTPANLQEVYVNARIDVLDATADLSAYQSDFNALIATYNAAAAELAAQQDAFDGGTWTTDLATANTDLLTAQGDLVDAQDAYDIAKTNFESDPTGSVVTDGAGNHSNGISWFDTVQFDLGYKGIEDLVGTTYMQVTSWRETTFGSGDYVPATFAATKYTPTTLAAKVTALIADAAYAIDDNTDVYVWEDNSQMPFDDYNQAGTSINYDSDAHSIVSTVPAMTQLALPTAAVFVEVESDDTEVTTLATFNIATNMLGTDNFSDKWLTSDGEPYSPGDNTWATPLAFSDTDAGYLSTWNGLGVMGAADTLTAQAVVWNAKLEQAKKQYAFDNSSTALDNAQAVYDYQKELFDNGAANLIVLAAAKTAATTAQTNAKKAVDNAWSKLGAEFIPGEAGNTKKTTTTAGYFVNFISGTKALTTNAVVFNAEVTLADLGTCDEDCQLLLIADKQHQIDLLQPSLDLVLSYIADMQAQYDTYMETYVGGGTAYANLDADLKVAYDILMNEKFQLQQELTNLTAEKAYVDSMVSALGSTSTLSQISLQIELAMLWDNAQGGYADSLADLQTAVNALAVAKANIDKGPAYIAYLQSLVDVLDTRYENASALAAKYKALMEAALAS